MKPRKAIFLIFAFAWFNAYAETDNLPQYRDWINQMKLAERGPFSRILWFCNDGSLQPPTAFGCREHSGGYQHGQWSQNTLALRENGYKVANVLAGIDAEAAISAADFRDTYGQILVEKYLVGVDDGWILRRAMNYRGAFQEEDERAGARKLLLTMAGQPEWLEAGYLSLRTGVKTLPHGTDNPSIERVRQLSASLSDQDKAFRRLRSKIHGAPDASDAQRVRDYASSRAPASLRPAYQELALEMDRLYQPLPLDQVLRERAAIYNLAPWLQQILVQAADELAGNPPALQRFKLTARLMVELRDALPRVYSSALRLQTLDLGLRTELEHFRAGAELRPALSAMPRTELISLLQSSAQAACGAGLINKRLMGEVDALLARNPAEKMNLLDYRSLLDYLARAPGWGMQSMRMHFQQPVSTLAELEPMAQLFIQDQLRGSPLLFYADVLDLLIRDVNRLLGIKHRLFDEEVGFGLTALNPGIARGVLHANAETETYEKLALNGVYLLPETIAELPPIAGILTAGEGNPLSHIQLLARNLGIPNVVISEALIPQLAKWDDTAVVLAVSPAGLVELATDEPRWDPFFVPAVTDDQRFIQPDLDKLDLSVRSLIPLSQLSAGDSGRIVGPKAAKLGELRRHYPGAAAHGIAIPFGIFNQFVLQQPYRGDASGQTTVWNWMVSQYRLFETLALGGEERLVLTEAFREELYDIVVSTPISAELRLALQVAIKDVFGPGETPGMFIRSDTNVEDLPGFSGAGLNLTLPNVVGFEALLEGIPRVWASPFTARAFDWRQALMTQPEHVYTSVLLLESIPVDKSGVLVTQDIDTGDNSVLTIVVNEGPGGAVDGQAAESLRVPLDGSRIKVLATATAPTQRVLLAAGGVRIEPSSGSEIVLEADEITQLIEFSKHLPETFPPVVNQFGEVTPMDVEFGFLDGKLRLFQIRPFLNSLGARQSDYLRMMDASLAQNPDQMIDLNGAPNP